MHCELIQGEERRLPFIYVGASRDARKAASSSSSSSPDRFPFAPDYICHSLSVNVFTHSLLPSAVSFHLYLSMRQLEQDAVLTLHAAKEARVFLTRSSVSVAKH